MRLPSIVPRTALAVAVLLPAVAAADETDVPIAAQEGVHQGVGVESTLAGVVGVSLRQGLGPMASLEAVVMASKGSGAYIPGGTFGSATTFGVATRAIVPFRRGDRGVIAGVGGIDLGVRTAEMAETAYHVALEAGLRGELFVVSHLSLSLEVGAVLDLPPDTGRVLRPEQASSRPAGSGTTISLDNTALAAGAGLTFWFR